MLHTIIAIATPLGAGALAVVKISGAHALKAVCHVLRIPYSTHALKPRYATLRTIYDINNIVLDEVIVIYFKSPYSFTGEDVLEIQCHGGSFVVQKIVDTFLCLKDRLPIRLAESGEFTKRAFINGKIDLTQAEAIAQISSIHSEHAQQIVMNQLKGALKDFVCNERKMLVEFLAHSEVGIDYAEEDLPDTLIDFITQRIDEKIFQFNRLLQLSIAHEQHHNAFRLALIGKPNTGKSSLLNALLLRNRAIVSDKAGTTRDTIEENLLIGQHNVILVDTAGIHKSYDIIENEGIQRSVDVYYQSDIILGLFDSYSFDDDDKHILQLLKTAQHADVIIVINKIDLGCSIDKKLFEGFCVVEISAKEGRVVPLLEQIEQFLQRKNHNETLLLSSKRQIEAFRTVVDELQKSLSPLKHGELELFSFHIQAALSSLDSITQPFCTDELLDMIFGKFCLGK